MKSDLPSCENPRCRRPIPVTAGHRPRRYCCDVCRKAVYRQRQEEKQRERVRGLASDLPQQSRQALEELMQTYDARAAELALDVVRHCFYEYKDIVHLMCFFRSHTQSV